MRDLRELGVLVLGLAAALPSGAYAGGVAGTKERVTFEGLVGRHEQSPIPDGYDGFGWSGTISAIGKGLYRDKQGLHAVLKGKVAAANLDGAGIIGRDDHSKFTFRSGHFAAFGNSSVVVVFQALRQGVVVGSVQMTIPPADTLVQFDKTFAHIDRFEIQSGIVAFDDLHVGF
jgi:hypothetical protein